LNVENIEFGFGPRLRQSEVLALTVVLDAR